MRVLSADAALAKLKEGNDVFVRAMTPPRPLTILERAALGRGQAPFASVLACSDSRTTPEILFNLGLGDIYVVRVAGNVVTRTELASLEFAALVLKSQLIVVMGHSECGAVQAAIELTKGQAFPGDIQALASIVEPAARSTKDKSGNWLANATLENIQTSVQSLRASRVLSDLVAAGSLKIVGAYYEVDSGVARFLY